MTIRIFRNLLLLTFFGVVYSLLPKAHVPTVLASQCCENLNCDGYHEACQSACVTLFPGFPATQAYLDCLTQCHNEMVVCAYQSCTYCNTDPTMDPCGPFGLFCAPSSPGTGAPSPGCTSSSNCPAGSVCGADGNCYGNINRSCTQDSDCPQNPSSGAGMFCYGGTHTCILYH